MNLGRGQVVPYPEPTSAAATKIGKANKRTDTKAEVRLRSALHATGLRFRKDMLIRAGDVRTRPDIVFTRAKVAVFVDGCFWHCCPEHFHMPKTNLAYWGPKLAANVARDARVTKALVVRRGFGLPVEGGSSTSDLVDDLVGGLGPDEGAGVLVPVVDPLVDGVGEVGDAGEDAVA